MQEKDLIRQLKAMREIKPREEWVSLTKSQILGQEAYEKRASFSFPAFNWKLAFAPAMAILLVAGFLFFSLALPKEQTITVAEEQEELEEIIIIAKSQDTEKIADMIKKTDNLVLALNELTETIKATPELAEMMVEDIEKMEKQTAKLGQTIAQWGKYTEQPEKAEELEEIVDRVELGLKRNVEALIMYFEDQILTEEQAELLAEAKEHYEAGELDKALEKLENIY